MTGAEVGQPTGRSERIRAALEVVSLGIKASEAYGRPDFAARLATVRERLEDPSFNVLVVGEFKQGKSTLINALLNAPVCPVDDDIATAVPTFVRYGPEPRAWALLEPDTDPPDDDSERPPPVREEFPIADKDAWITETGNPGNVRRLRAVDIALPRQLLQHGLVLVDTPGVGGLGSVHTATTIGALPWADAVLFVSDASQEYSGPELEFLRTARDLCPNVLCVLTKIDFYPEWRRIAEINRGHLDRAGIRADIVPVSSTLRLHAIAHSDRELNAESGFPGLVSYLTDRIVQNAEQLSVTSAMTAVLQAVAQMEANFLSEREALSDPEGAAALVARLEEARTAAEELRGRAAKWQQTLADGIADLQADVDHDLRARMRAIMAQADAAIDESDPADTWAEFEPWLYRRVAEDVTHNYTFLQLRAREVSSRVAEHFALDEQNINVDLRIEVPGEVLDARTAVTELDVERPGAGQKALLGVRSGYGGMLMTSFGFGILGIAGAAVMPIGLGAAILMGRKAVREDAERRLTMRRQQAKQAVRRYIDEVSFTVTKDVRDTLRRVQRDLRDHWSARAEELHRSTTEALKAAQAAVQSNQAERQQRLAAVNAELGRLDALRKRALAVAPTASAAAGSGT